MADEIVEHNVFDELYNEIDVAAEKRDLFLNKLSFEMSKMISVMDKAKKAALIELLHNNVKKMVDGSSLNEIEEGELKIKNLEDREIKLIVKFNQVMSNLYLLPGYVLAVSTGISGLLSSDPHICGLMFVVVLVVLSFLGALGLAVIFAHRQLGPLILKHNDLATERQTLHQSFQKPDALGVLGIMTDGGSPGTVGTDGTGTSAVGTDGTGTDTASTDTAGKKLKSFEEVNLELKFQADYFKWFLWPIFFCGLLYSLMLIVAGQCALCDCKAISFNTIVDHWLWLLTPYL